MSEEIKRIENIRRNSNIASGISLFIGLTQSIPNKFIFIGIELDDDGKNVLGMFIFFITLYYYLYFISTTLPQSLINFTIYRHNKFEKSINNKIDSIIYNSKFNRMYKLKWFALMLELMPPLIIGLCGLITLGIYIF
jgi:hypothetical protein